MYLRPHRTLRFDSRSLLCQTTTNAALWSAIDRRKKMCHQDFYNTTALRKAPRHGALRVPHARCGPRTASVTPLYMFTRNVLNNLRNDDAQVLL